MNRRVTLIDYGMANLLNVARAFEHCGAEVHITEDPGAVPGSERVVVPGVGAFKDCMDEFTTRGFGDVVSNFVDTGRPILGICIGMQILFDVSEEFGQHRGLGLLPGRVTAVPGTTVSGKAHRVPHIGWDQLIYPETGRRWGGTLLAPHDGGCPAVYFVHSFAANPTDPSDRLADCDYGGHRICAAVQRRNLMATQFHPERSGETGLAVIRRFLEI